MLAFCARAGVNTLDSTAMETRRMISFRDHPVRHVFYCVNSVKFPSFAKTAKDGAPPDLLVPEKSKSGPPAQGGEAAKRVPIMRLRRMKQGLRLLLQLI